MPPVTKVRPVLPAELRRAPRWIIWRRELRGESFAKIPVNPATGQPCDVTDRSAWLTYFEAKRAAAAQAENIGGGLGFVFDGSDRVVGVDLDHCCSEPGVLLPWAAEALRSLGSYAEWSPSGEGVHAYVLADASGLVGNRSRVGQSERVEVYWKARFFTVTRLPVDGFALPLREAQAELEAFHARYVARPGGGPGAASAPRRGYTLSDEALLQRIRESRQGKKFAALWDRADLSAYSGDESAADMALCSMLAYWTRRDAARMERLFSQSALGQRAKWVNRPDYRERTCRRAADTAASAYAPWFDGPKGDFLPEVLADEVVQRLDLIAYPVDEQGRGARLYAYRDGVYSAGAEHAVRVQVAELLEARSQPRYENAVLDVVRRRAAAPEAEVNAGARDLINVENGMLDWRTGELSAHGPQHRSTIRIHAAWDPEARDEALDRVWSELLAPDLQDALEELVGYLLVPDNSMKVAAVLLGPPDTGKSTVLHQLEGLVGPENSAKVPLHDLGENRFAAADLAGKLLCVYDDLDSRALKHTSLFKVITGGGSLAAERKYGGRFDFTPFARIVFAANAMPRSADKSEAFVRRLYILPFDRPVRVADRSLWARLDRPGARAALLARAVRGLRRLTERGSFPLLERVEDEKEEYRRDNDTAHAFLDERAAASAGGKVGMQELYDAYRAWCEDTGAWCADMRALNRAARASFPAAAVRRLGPAGGSRRTWCGVELKER